MPDSTHERCNGDVGRITQFKKSFERIEEEKEKMITIHEIHLHEYVWKYLTGKLPWHPRDRWKPCLGYCLGEKVDVICLRIPFGKRLVEKTLAHEYVHLKINIDTDGEQWRHNAYDANTWSGLRQWKHKGNEGYMK